MVGCLHLRPLLEAKEKFRSLLKIRATQLQRRKHRKQAAYLNHAYRRDGPTALLGRAELPKDVPTESEISGFWKEVVGSPGTFDPGDEAIESWRTDLTNITSNPDHVEVSDTIWRSVIKKTKSWKAPGSDGIHGFWLKVFPKSGCLLKQLVEQAINQEITIPQWLVTGRTVLIPKDPNASTPDKFRPIACLNTIYKTFTATVERVVNDHITTHRILPHEQCALRRGRRGCFDALMIDTMVSEDATLRSRDLSVSWIDYQKAFDYVPHGWLVEALKLCKIPDRIQRCLGELTSLWRTVFTLRHAGGILATEEVQYRRGLFQGDSLSPLLFCLCMTPLSYALRNTPGYSTKCSNTPVTHLMFVDDLKVYAPSEVALSKSMEVVERVSSAIGMKVGIQKCATASIRKGKVVESQDLVYGPQLIGALSEGKSYKYLGIHQVFRAVSGGVRESLKKAYLERLSKIWSSRLSARNKIHASNVWAVSLFRYYFSSPLKWTKTQLRDLDRMTRATLRKHRCHYRGASVERLYLRWDRGGRGLHNLYHVYQREVVAAAAYLVTSSLPIHQTIVKHMLWKAGKNRHSLIMEAEKIVQEMDLSVPLTREDIERVGAKKLVRIMSANQQDVFMEALKAKTIHGVFMKTSLREDRDFRLTHRWLRRGKQRAETEALIVAAQDGVIMTRAYQSRVLKLPVNPMCRRCHKRPETIGHILSHCDAHFWSLYKERHDRVVAVLYHHLCRTLGLKVLMPWEPIPPVQDNDKAKLLWDPSIPTDRVLEHRRPDMVLTLKLRSTILLFEMACAYDSLLREREQEKANKYQELAADMACQNPGYSVKVVPLVIGDLGSIGGLAESLRTAPIFTPRQLSAVLDAMQSSVIYASTRILKRHLAV